MIASRGMRRGCGAPWSARRTLSSVPKWSFHGRPLPSELVALESSTGRQMFARALNGGTAECYFRLANQFLTQSSPPSCGVTSLAMILNAMNVDPNRRWKGGWRWFDEEVVLGNCCKSAEEVEENGITMHEFASMARCHGAHAEHWHHRSDASASGGCGRSADLDTFRRHVVASATSPEPPLVVACFDRSSLGQTGSGHFSPIGAYDAASDSVLVLDVARFKYPPWWTTVTDLYAAMEAVDVDSGLSRGYFRISPTHEKVTTTDATRPHTQRAVPADGGGGGVCPAHDLMRTHCPLGRSKCAKLRWRYHDETKCRAAAASGGE